MKSRLIDNVVGIGVVLLPQSGWELFLYAFNKRYAKHVVHQLWGFNPGSA